MYNTIPYYLVPDKQTIYFLYNSWYERSRYTRSERQLQKLVSTIKTATGLQRIWRRNHHEWRIVEFRIKQHYTKTAVALALSFQRDWSYDKLFKQFVCKNIN